MLRTHTLHYSRPLASALLLVAAMPAAAQEVTRGPYLQMATPESAVVVWRTNQAIEPVVKIGPSPEGLTKPFGSEDATVRLSVDVAAEYPAPYGAVPLLYDEPQATTALRRPGERTPSTPGKTWQYEVSVTGLQPGKKYYYGVFDDKKTDRRRRPRPLPDRVARSRFAVEAPALGRGRLGHRRQRPASGI